MKFATLLLSLVFVGFAAQANQHGAHGTTNTELDPAAAATAEAESATTTTRTEVKTEKKMDKKAQAKRNMKGTKKTQDEAPVAN